MALFSIYKSPNLDSHISYVCEERYSVKNTYNNKENKKQIVIDRDVLQEAGCSKTLVPIN